VGIEANPRTARRLPARHCARRGAEIRRWILGIDATFHGHAAVDDLLLLEAQRLAGGDADLLADQVDAGDQLRHRVLDLDAGVDLNEVKLVFLVDQELAGTGILVLGGPDHAQSSLADLRAHLGRQVRRRRLLHQFSDGGAAGCNRAPTDGRSCPGGRRGSAPRCAGAVRCTSPGNAAILEGVLGFLLGRFQACLQADVVAGDAHAATAAAGRGLDQDGVAHLVSQLQGFGIGVDQALAAGNDRDNRPVWQACGPRSCCRAGASPPGSGR